MQSIVGVIFYLSLTTSAMTNWCHRWWWWWWWW